MRIYISSTFRDLQKHRQAVSVVLRRMGHQPIGMEEYVAEGMRPLNRCLADVEACDAYIGIVAWRYGSKPTESGAANVTLPPGTALNKTSTTEFEFRQAVESGKPVLMFVLDPDAEWPSGQFDAVTGDDQGKAINELRREVSQQYLVSYFRTAEELASLVSAGIYRLEMSRQMTLESLRIEPKFNQPFVRNGPVSDSTLMEIKSVIAGPQKIQGLQIDIGQGHDWWMTRLYFLSSLAVDLARIEVMVLVAESESFCGIVDPRIVKERLAEAYPMLRQYEEVLSRSGPPQADPAAEIDRRAAIWASHMDAAAGGEQTVAIFVTSQGLDRWLSPYWITLAVELQPTENGALQMQRLMDWPMRFVPVVQNGKFVRVVDKRALTEQIARLFVREQVSRALSMTR